VYVATNFFFFFFFFSLLNFFLLAITSDLLLHIPPKHPSGDDTPTKSMVSARSRENLPLTPFDRVTFSPLPFNPVITQTPRGGEDTPSSQDPDKTS